MEKFQESVSKVATFNDLIYMLGITFCCVGLAHLMADNMGPWISEILDGMNDSTSRLLVSFGNKFFWLVVLATIFGVLLSFYKI